ncbi:type IV secretory system conjugative DNA transfer family protein, partial [Serratia marcescens]|uniref:type IV secretory system conjugative DNA transfer family protein n=1 Tax=Serratia marcescens TaxID=615 RepID=UPI0021CCDA5C
MFAIPEIDIYSRSEEKPSMVVLDLKTEMTKTSYMALVERGYDVQILNIENPEMGFLYNPLSLITKAYKQGDIPQAELLCNSFAYSIYSSPDSTAGDQNAEFFVSNATNAVAAAILAHISDCLDEDKRQNAKYLLKWKKYQKKFLQLPLEDQQVIRKIFKKLHNQNLSTEEYFTLLELPG